MFFRYKSNSDLIRHETLMHPDPDDPDCGPQLLQCPVENCSYTAKHAKSLDYHTAKVHRQELQVRRIFRKNRSILLFLMK